MKTIAIKKWEPPQIDPHWELILRITGVFWMGDCFYWSYTGMDGYVLWFVSALGHFLHYYIDRISTTKRVPDLPLKWIGD